MVKEKLTMFFEDAQKQYPFRFLYENIYAALCRLIILEYAEPGSTLCDSEVAEHLNISRTPVRRAFEMLIKDGLLEYLDEKEYRIPIPDAKSMTDIMVFRESLEPPMAYSAAKHATDHDLKELWQIMQKFKNLDTSKVLTREENEKIFKIEALFHKTLCDMCTNPYLTKVYIDNIIPIYRSLFNNSNYRLRENMQAEIAANAAYQAHLQIYSSLKYHNGRMAMEAVFTHLHRAKY